MNGCRCNTVLFVFIFLSVLTTSATGRRGCLNYGHSCLGGHGKRSSNREEMRSDIENFLPPQRDVDSFNTISEEDFLSDDGNFDRKWRDLVFSALERDE